MKKAAFVMMAMMLFTLQHVFAQYDKIVAKDGTGNYTTVQAAIDAAPTGLTAPYRIFIKNGTYKEIVTVPSNKPFIQLVGEDVGKTIITYDNYSGKAIPGGGTYGTSTSATVTVNATDFSAVNITFQNTTGESPQALAINVNNDRASFKNCRFLGGQDTLLANNNGLRQYYLDCYIDGDVDFIFGNARAVFDDCVIYPKDRSVAGSSYITAANTKNPEPYGFVFRNSQITDNTGATSYYLGRPWQNDGVTTSNISENKTVFLNCKMGSVINPAGWSTWDSGTNTSLITYGEYNTQNLDGTTYDVSSRVSWSKQFTSTDAANYSDANLFSGWDPTGMFTDGASYTSPLVVSNFQGTKGSSSTTFKWNISWPITGVQYDLYRSTDNGANFSIVSTQTSSTSNVNFNYSESNPPPGTSYQYYVKASKSGYSDYTSDVVTISSVPTITVTGSLSSFLQGLGTPSTSQTYTVSGVDLTNDIVITAPAGYEISNDGGSNWHNSSSPISLTPSSGTVASTTISVRLNATSAATYSGNITHTSTGAISVNQAVTGTTQTAPLLTSSTVIYWPLTASNADDATSRATGVNATTPTFTGLTLSNGTYNAAFPPYGTTHGQSFGVSANGGSWQTSSGGPGNLSRSFYEEFTVQPSSNYQVRVDSIIFNTSLTLTSGSFAVSYSTDDFSTITDVNSGIGPDGNSITFTSNGAFSGTAIAMIREDASNLSKFKFPISNLTVQSGQTLKIRIYFRTGSSSDGRYVKIKDFYVKGESSLAPVAGDYQSHQSGDWTSLSTWERYDGTSWVTPAPDYPVYNNSGKTTIKNGHTVTVSSTLANGSGYIHLTTVNLGGQIIVNSGATLKLANDGDSNTTDFLVNGDVNVNGSMQTNGNCAIEVAGKLVNSGSLTFNNTGDTFTVDDGGIYQHNANTPNAPDAIWKTGSTFWITGLTTSQTSIFKSAVNYYNIIWDNQNEQSGKYYAIRGNLGSTNVLGKFTVKSTGATYITLLNADGTIGLPGGYEQTGGRVLVRESGTVNATFNIGKDFIVSGGTFESNSAASVTINLNGASSQYSYNDATNTLTNLAVGLSGDYTLASPLSMNTLALSGTGKITLGSYNLTVSSLTGGSPTAYIITNGTGKLKINNVGASNVTFPVGTSSTSYNPVVLNNSGTVDNFSVSVQNTFDNATPDNNKVVSKQWNIEEDVAGGSNVTLSLGWLAADQAAGFDPSSATSILHYTGGNWNGTNASVSGAGTSVSPYIASASGFSSFSPFTVGNTTILPLDILSFNASLVRGLSPQVNLTWKTTNEVNTSSFDLERSVDGKSFSKIGAVSAVNKPGNHDYQFTDENPVSGTSYYRFKQIDLNGAFKYSSIVSVNNQGNIVLSAYPNPTQDILNITYPKANAGAKIAILSLSGQKVLEIPVQTESTKSSIALSGVASGTYLLLYNNGKDQSIYKFIKD